MSRAAADRLIDFQSDITPWERSVHKVMRLAASVPNGLDRLRAFEGSGADRFASVERIKDGQVVIELHPSAALNALIRDLGGKTEGAA